MALRDQKRLMAEMDRMNGRRLGKIAKAYQQSVIGPILAEVKKAKTVKGLLKQFGPGLIKKMNTAVLEDAIQDTQVQMGLIGRASALPRRKDEG